MAELDYATVHRYWNAAQPSILAPYMMDGFGFPAGAGRFRFRAESKIVHRLIAGIDPNGTVLDLGSGMGYWAEFFSHRFANVVAVEGSLPLFEDLERRCAPYANVQTLHGMVSEFEPEGVDGRAPTARKINQCAENDDVFFSDDHFDPPEDFERGEFPVQFRNPGGGDEPVVVGEGDCVEPVIAGRFDDMYCVARSAAADHRNGYALAHRPKQIMVEPAPGSFLVH